jgi:hypothetical protein
VDDIQQPPPHGRHLQLRPSLVVVHRVRLWPRRLHVHGHLRAAAAAAVASATHAISAERWKVCYFDLISFGFRSASELREADGMAPSGF